MAKRGSTVFHVATRHLAAVTFALAAVFALAIGALGLGSGFDQAIQAERSALLNHSASGNVLVVEIDARSIARIDHWPWDRRNHAMLVDRLRRAGAASIAFDVDFSSRSTPAGDAAFAAALARAGGSVVLPTLRQVAGNGDASYVDSLPIPELRSHSMAAAVSVIPDHDGAVRFAPTGVVTFGVPRPSLSSIIAGQSGAAGHQFPVNYAIDPATIPRLSFIDVRDGRFDPTAVRGKRVLVGATAVEVGDRYGVPRFGVVPGVVIQALAAETLMAGMPVQAGWPVPMLIALAMAALIVRARTRLVLAGAILASPLALFLASVAAERVAGWRFQLVPGLAVLVVAASGAVLAHIVRIFGESRRFDAHSGMPNRLALLESVSGGEPVTIVVARIAGYDKLLAAFGVTAAAEIACRVRDRISMLGQGVTVYRVEDRVLAWHATVDVDQVEIRVDQLRRMMMLPVEVKGRQADVALAIGVASGSCANIAAILANAGLAAAQAQAEGSGWHIHSEAETEAVAHEVSLLGELDAAILAGDIEVLYQPKLHIASDRITSVEALVRWNHPERGLLRPDLFIPLAEQNGRIAGLTLHVLRQTIADVRAWAALGTPISGAVNISAKLLTDHDFLASARALIQETGIDSSRLTLEVTESATMHDPQGAVAALVALKALGVAISMDDYGTGHSTLAYLKQLPLDELKLDRSFVQFAHQNRSDAVLVRSTVDLAHDLGLKVVAEGVENAECLDFLRSIGCDMAQGYLISRPVSHGTVTDLLRQPSRRAA